MKRLALFLAISLAAMPAAAQAGFSAAQREACQADYRKFCTFVIPGGGRIVKCLREHSAELTGQCRAAVVEAASVLQACQADYHKFCGSVTPGGGAVLKCLRGYNNQLDASCRKAIGGTATAAE